MNQQSLQTRMTLAAGGLPIAMVSYESQNRVYYILTSEEALRARRAVASAAVADAARLRAFLALRERRPMQPNWEMLQTALFSAGLSVCPTSGSPVFSLEDCSPRLRTALWDVLVAMQAVINDKTPGATQQFEAALAVLRPMVERRAQA
tara:strand:+ start:396 stop:842 length:447 start_codon:yes stop_codon:yes gene_type:complete